MRTKTKMKRSLERTLLTCTMSLLAAACGVEGDDGDLTDEQDQLSAPESSLQGANAAAQLEVTANGSGCPSGTWKAELAPDKRSFNVSLSGLAAEVNQTSSVASKECALAIKVKGGYSYALQGLAFEGRATLARGVSATAGGSFAFQGSGPTAPETTTKLAGPSNGSFRVERTVPDNQLEWSTCGVERNINVRTSLRLRSEPAGAAGSIRVTNLGGALADGKSAAALGFRVALRACNGQTVTPTTTPTTTPSPALPSGGNISVDSITASGSGCPSGTWTAERVQGGTGLTVNFLGYEPKTDANTSVAVKSCMLSAKVKAPAGVSYAVSSANYTGHAAVNPGATAELNTFYYFQGVSTGGLVGGKSFSATEAFSYLDSVPESRLVWSECGVTRDLNISTRLKVSGGTGSINLSKLSDIKFVTKACSAASSQVDTSSTSSSGTVTTTGGPGSISVTRS